MLVDGPNAAAAGEMSSDSTTAVTTVAAATQGQDEQSSHDIVGPPGMLSVVQSQVGSPSPQQQQSSGPLVEYPHDPPDTKEGIEELCPVCGDKVSGYHYGLLTCESCKGFFKRTVQNKKVYTCVADRSCHIDKSQRKRCPYCRFQKCLDVGMKLEAVRADRMRGGRNKFGPMYKRDRARKLQMMRQKQIQRAQCLGGMMGNNEVTNSLPPPFAPPALPSPSMYSNDPHHIKQELIQIPQLSSSTSSPDSSPSPLCTSAQTNSTMGAHFALAGGPPVLSTVPEPIKAISWAPNRAPSPPHPTGSSNGGTTSGSPKPPYHYGDVSPVPLTVANPSTMLLGSGKIPHLIKEFQVSMPDDKEWQSQLFGLLQNQTYNQCEVDLFELMCKVIDQSLFAQVDWARNSIFFKELKVDDQMKLLQHSWSDMLVLDHLHQRLHNGLPEEITMPNGQKFSMVNLALLGVASMSEQLNHVSARLQELKFDPIDYICLKFLLLLNPDIRNLEEANLRELVLLDNGLKWVNSFIYSEVRTLSNVKLVVDAYDRTQQALVEYTLSCYPQVPDKFNNLMTILPEIHVISERGEDFLLYRHLNGSAPSQTLLMEMLHAKKK